MLLLEQHGTLPLREVMRYAIGYARDGYPMSAGASAAIASAEQLFTGHWPASAEIYLAAGGPRRGPGSPTRTSPRTYERILDEAEAAGAGREQQIEAARRAYYEGFVAEAIDAFTASAEVMDLTGERHRALLRGADLSGWRARHEAPATLGFAGLTVCKTGPWGQGPVFLQQLALLDELGVAAAAPGSADFIHLVVECAKLAFADREAWYGDPRFADVPLEALLSRAYAVQRSALVGAEASAELRPGRPGGASRGCRATPPGRPGTRTG